MPEGASRVLSVSRPGMRDLVAVACTESDALVIYDDEIGTVARLVEGIAQPYDVVAVTRKAGGKRLFVASFGNHTVDVVDIPDLQRPGEAKLVGQLGTDSEENP
jgi:tricorn protease-like protein